MHEVRKGLWASFSWLCCSGADWLGRQTPTTWKETDSKLFWFFLCGLTDCFLLFSWFSHPLRFAEGGQTMKNLQRLADEFELDQSQRQSTQVGSQTKRKSSGNWKLASTCESVWPEFVSWFWDHPGFSQGQLGQGRTVKFRGEPTEVKLDASVNERVVCISTGENTSAAVTGISTFVHISLVVLFGSWTVGVFCISICSLSTH